jgi:hypothetical protein
MPLLMFVILVAVQLTMVYLGNSAASAVAREASRVARVTDDPGKGELAGRQYALNIGQGILEGVHVQVVPVSGGERMRAVVTGHAQELIPSLVPTVKQTVEGPVEEFRQDTP